MYIPDIPCRVVLKVTTKARRQKVKLLRRKSVSAGEVFRKMSDSPSDLAAGWTFVSSTSEVNEEMQNGSFDVTDEVPGDLNEPIDATRDTSSDVDKAVVEEEIEVDDDDLPAVSSESESLPSSDVDILEESVGPDHDMLHVTSISSTSSFSISSPLEGTSKSLCTGSANIPSELTETKQVNAEIENAIPCDSEEPWPAVSVKSPKCNAHAVQSSEITDNSYHPKSKEPVQEQGCAKKNIKRLPVPKSKRHSGMECIIESLSVAAQEISGADSIETAAPFFILLLLFVFLPIFVSVILIILLPPPTTGNAEYLSRNTAADLKYVQDKTLKCLGLQHLTALENDHYEMLFSDVCVNDSVAWKSNFEKLLGDKVLKPLIYEVYGESSIQRKTEIIEKFMAEERNGVQGIKFDLLLRQLEYLELLNSAEESNDVKGKYNKDSAASALFSEKLEEQEQLLGQLHHFIDQLKLGNFVLNRLDAELKTVDGTEGLADLVALKPRVYRLQLENAFLSNQLQHMLDQFESGEFLDPEYWMGSSNLNNGANIFKSNKMEELMEKVDTLLSTSDELRRTYAQFSDVKPKNRGGDGITSTVEEETTSKWRIFPETGGETRESLFKELLALHQTLAGELMEVRKWNEMLAEIADELRSLHRDRNSGRWIWSTFKQAFDGMFDGAHMDLTQRLKDIQNLDVSGLFHKYAGERRPFIKDVFQSIKSFWEKTGTKSREFIEKALQEVKTDFSLSGIFNSVGSGEKLPGDSETSNGDVPEKNPDQQLNFYQDDLHSSQGNEEVISVDDVSGHERTDFDKLKANWLFQRAADRESLRHTSQTRPINWYLRREQNMWRSPMTPEQRELLEKMEISQYPAPAKSYSRESKDPTA